MARRSESEVTIPSDTYLDHASAAPMHERAKRALVEALDAFGDPLRLHANGRAARRVLDDAREQIAAALGAQPDEIVFTSGGTESVALAIWGGVRPIRELGARIVTTRIEHPAVGGVLHTLESDGFESILLDVDGDGRVDLDAFAAEVRRPATLLASLQHANHEVGTMQPVAEAGRLSREAGVLFHTDACQTAGRLPVDAGALGVDLLSVSAHKFGGPPGVGALFVRRGVPIAAYPCGDDRERKRRSGMENVPGIAGMAAAIEASLADLADQAAAQWALTARLRDAFGGIPGVRVHGHETQRVPHLVCFTVDDLDPEILAMALDDRGFRLAVGSNCSGVSSEPSPVLDAMGVPGMSSFRIGTGRDTTPEEIDRFLEVLPVLVEDLRQVETRTEAAMSRFGSPAGPGAESAS
jgi:cysteine desulfurase